MQGATSLKALLYSATAAVVVGAAVLAVVWVHSNRDDERRRQEVVEVRRAGELDRKGRETPLTDIEREELRQLNERIAKREIENRAK